MSAIAEVHCIRIMLFNKRAFTDAFRANSALLRSRSRKTHERRKWKKISMGKLKVGAFQCPKRVRV